jgi:hypothetical protein
MKTKTVDVSSYPEMHKKRLRRFIRTRNFEDGISGRKVSTKQALEDLVEDIRNRIKRPTVKQFEQDERESGTAIALYNAIWIIASDIMHDIGVKRIRTSNKEPK